jgi:hypothetical protein
MRRKGLRARHRLAVWPASPGNAAIVRDGSGEALSSSAPSRPAATRVSASCVRARSMSMPSRNAQDDRRREPDAACPGPSAGEGTAAGVVAGEVPTQGRRPSKGVDSISILDWFGVASGGCPLRSRGRMIASSVSVPVPVRDWENQQLGNAIRIDREDHVWTDHSGLDSPKALLTSRIKTVEIDLHESTDRNVLACVFSRKEATEPPQIGPCATAAWPVPERTATTRASDGAPARSASAASRVACACSCRSCRGRCRWSDCGRASAGG